PPGRASWWCRALPAPSAHRARAGRGGTACGGPAHHPLSPNRVGLAPPTGGASPSTGWVAFATPPLQAHGRRDVVASPVPTPEEGTTGSRARRDRGGFPVATEKKSTLSRPVCWTPAW